MEPICRSRGNIGGGGFPPLCTICTLGGGEV